jgi:O-antigen/teichoic acid export membrane protein
MSEPNDFLKGFLSITVIFTIAHGVFVLALVFLFKIGGEISWEEARWALNYAIVVQGLFLLWDLPQVRGWSFSRLSQTVGQVQIRVLVTQLGLIFGMMMAGMTGSAWGLVGTFVAMRALCDAGIAGLQGFVKRRDLPPGLARFLSKRSKQSVESLEAEFDALKRDGAEVEALLERPIGELRR